VTDEHWPGLSWTQVETPTSRKGREKWGTRHPAPGFLAKSGRNGAPQPDFIVEKHNHRTFTTALHPHDNWLNFAYLCFKARKKLTPSGGSKMIRHIRSILMAVAIAVLALMSSAAMAQSYTGKWPATVTKSQRDNGKDCITLTDDGSYGFHHSGEAVLNGQNNGYPGYFTVVDEIMTVTFTFPSGEGDCCDFEMLTAPASKGQIGKGVFNYLGLTDIGVVNFGKKNGCTD